jgi:hypothetical protein
MNASEYLAQLPERGRVYIAGPMRGLPNLNKDAFYIAERNWRKAGWLVVNPAKLDSTADDMTFAGCMRRDIKKITVCHALAILPGIEKSEGGNIEEFISLVIGNRVFDANTFEEVDLVYERVYVRRSGDNNRFTWPKISGEEEGYTDLGGWKANPAGFLTPGQQMR